MRYENEVVKINFRICVEKRIIKIKNKVFNALKFIIKRLKSKINIIFFLEFLIISFWYILRLTY